MGSSVGRGMADGRDLRPEWVGNVTKSKEPGWLVRAARATVPWEVHVGEETGRSGEADHEGRADLCAGSRLGSG